MAHALLLHGVLDVEALSSGVWYVAIDFQLYALLTGLFWLGRGQAWRVRTVVLGLMLASLLFFNRDVGWDNWALYFFGAYALGASAFWAARSERPGWMLGWLACVGLVTLAIDFRWRIALALATALLLGLIQWRTRVAETSDIALAPGCVSRTVRRLGQSSYALFLVHFPILMLGNAVFARMGLTGAGSAGLVLLISWSASVGLALLFERWVERGPKYFQ